MINHETTQMSTCLWFPELEGKKAADFYAQVFGDAFQLKSENPMVSVYHLFGRQYMHLNHAKAADFNTSVSFVIHVDTQSQIDYYWEKLVDGGSPGQCGWLTDKFGVSWQIVPNMLGKLMSNPETAPKATYAFLQMSKFNIAQLEAAVN
jgi:predicted 3-demethylubiquinone-9 3-methyltransferase (glyoxalase superfamily)